MIEGLVRALYAALGAGDAPGVEALLDPAFEAHFADGLPLGLGGRREGAAAARADGWWAIGRVFVARAEPAEWIHCADGRLLVTGRYAGRARGSGRTFDAAFAHLWTERGGRLVALSQFTDTARWQEALDS